MALSHGRNLGFVVQSPSTGSAAVSLSTTTQEVNGLPGEQDLLDSTVAGNVGHTSFPGLQKASFTSKHLFDDAAGLSWATLGGFQACQQTYTSTTWIVQFGPKGTTSGYPEVKCYALIKQVSMPIRVTDLNTFTVSWEMSAGTSGATATTW